MSVVFADITLPLWLVISQWTLLFALGFLIIVMYRQVALLQELKDAGSEREGLSINETDRVDEVSLEIQRPPHSRWSLHRRK
jgi:hypothetical protein